MIIDIVEQRENPLFKRKDVVAIVNYGSSATPSKKALQKALADQLKVNAENVEIIKVLSDVGLAKGKAWIKIWQDKKVPLYTEKKAKAEAPKEEAKAEPPKE
jgi:ribosomal protein S24E